MDTLVEKRGPKGLFHVNDFCPAYAEFAVRHLREYAQEKHYNLVQIDPIPGDYTLIDPQTTLGSYGKTKYSSVHLKNPEMSFFAEGLKEWTFYSSTQASPQARAVLQQLANLFEEGLYFFSYYHDMLPKTEQQATDFYRPTREWQTFPYFFPDGVRVSLGEQAWFIRAVKNRPPTIELPPP